MKYTILPAAIVLSGMLTGCAGMDAVLCGMSAVGADISGRPEPSCVKEIEAQGTGLPAQGVVSSRSSAQNEPAPGAKGLAEQADSKRLQIAAQRRVIARHKEGANLTDDQIKDLVTIEGVLVQADELFLQAKDFFLASNANLSQDANLRRSAFLESVKTYNAAMSKHDKATLDLEALLAGMGLQTGTGRGNPNSTTAP